MMDDISLEYLQRTEKERLEFWLKERIRFRETSIFNFDNGEQVAETGIMRGIRLTNPYKLRKIAIILGVRVNTESYSNLWWKDSFQYLGYEFSAMRMKEKKNGK